MKTLKAQERQATRPLQKLQSLPQEIHSGELTNEDGEKTERERQIFKRRRLRPCEKEHLCQGMSGWEHTNLATLEVKQ